MDKGKYFIIIFTIVVFCTMVGALKHIGIKSKTETLTITMPAIIIYGDPHQEINQ